MASHRLPGPMCRVSRFWQEIDEGTLCRGGSPQAGSLRSSHPAHKQHLSKKGKPPTVPPLPVTDQAFLDRIRQHEGVVPFMYLDTNTRTGKHLVTVGIGFLLEDAKGHLTEEALKGLKFVRRTTGETATLPEIRADFERVKAAGLPKGLTYGQFLDRFRKATKLSLDEKCIERRFQELVDQFQEQLRQEFPLYDAYPRPARYALLDMIFNLGRGSEKVVEEHGTARVRRTGIHAYRELRRALDAKTVDWDAVASQSFRGGIGGPRNQETESWFHQAGETRISFQ